MDITSVALVAPQPQFGFPDPYLTSTPRKMTSPILNAVFSKQGRIKKPSNITLSGTTVTIPATTAFVISDGALGMVYVYLPTAVVLPGVAVSNKVYMYLSQGADGQTYTVQLETAAAAPAGSFTVGSNNAGAWADDAGIAATVVSPS